MKSNNYIIPWSFLSLYSVHLHIESSLYPWDRNWIDQLCLCSLLHPPCIRSDAVPTATQLTNNNHALVHVTRDISYVHTSYACIRLDSTYMHTYQQNKQKHAPKRRSANVKVLFYLIQPAVRTSEEVDAKQSIHMILLRIPHIIWDLCLATKKRQIIEWPWMSCIYKQGTAQPRKTRATRLSQLPSIPHIVGKRNKGWLNKHQTFIAMPFFNVTYDTPVQCIYNL